VTAPSDFESYRKEIELDVRRVREQLSPAEAESIRLAVEQRHGDWHRLIVGTGAERLGLRFLAALAEAELELTADQVRELEQLAQDGLAPAS